MCGLITPKKHLPLLFTAALVSSVVTSPAVGHEEYVVEEREPVALPEFYADALGEPLVIGSLVGGMLLVIVSSLLYLRLRPGFDSIQVFRRVMQDYTTFVPWLLRIALGIPLIGAGFEGYFISPAVEFDLRVLQVGLGFLLLFGLFTRVAAFLGLLAYFGGLWLDPLVLLQLEFVGGLLAIGLLGSGRPSADHTLGQIIARPDSALHWLDDPLRSLRTRLAIIQNVDAFVPVVLRVGLGVTFLVLGVTQKLLQPGLALGVVERYGLTAVAAIPPELWVIGAGLVETGLGLALLLGLFTRASALLGLSILTLTLFALPDDPVLAHVALFGMASAILIVGAGPFALDSRIGAPARTTDS